MKPITSLLTVRVVRMVGCAGTGRPKVKQNKHQQNKKCLGRVASHALVITSATIRCEVVARLAGMVLVVSMVVLMMKMVVVVMVVMVVAVVGTGGRQSVGDWH